MNKMKWLMLAGILASHVELSYTNCSSTIIPGYHWPADTSSIYPLGNISTASDCASACCNNTLCGHWVFTTSEPPPHLDGGCPTGKPCCWLKPGAEIFPRVADPNMTIGTLPPAPPKTQTTVEINKSTTVAPPMDPRFVSVGCEMWEWLFDPDALKDPVMIQVGKTLAPGVFRVGGISADQTHFTTKPFPPDTPWPPPSGSTNTNLLNMSTFDGLIKFCNITGLSLIFNVNELWGRPFEPHGSSPPPALNLSGVSTLLQYAAESGALYPTGPLFAIELGNELTPRILDPVVQAADYVQFRQLLDSLFPQTSSQPAPLLYGPASCSCDNMTEFLVKSKEAHLDAFTFHSYPMSGRGSSLPKSLVDPETLQHAITDGLSCWIEAWKAANVSMPFFLSETNSDAATFANAGQATFANGFWYMASLAYASLAGMPFHTRWKLWNPRVSYRPGALNQTFGFLDKALKQAVPDLWIATLHKTLIGSGAPYATKSDNSGVLAFANQGGKETACPGSTVISLLNTEPVSVYVTINVQHNNEGMTYGDSPAREEYIFTPWDKSLGPASTSACLNSEGCDDPLQLDDDGSPPPLPPRKVSVNTPLQMPPMSYGYIVLDACN